MMVVILELSDSPNDDKANASETSNYQVIYTRGHSWCTVEKQQDLSIKTHPHKISTASRTQITEYTAFSA